MNELYHHGVKGMKWGVRRYQNKDGSLTAAGQARLGAKNLKKAKTANLDKWGKTPDSNILYVAGYSGSGKSTTALSMIKPGDKVIHLDAYSEPDSGGAATIRDKTFNRYLDKHVPKWRDMANATSSAENGTMRRNSKEYYKVVDQFQKALEGYSKDQFLKGHRVVAEGVQIADDWLADDKSYYSNKPIIILRTGAVTSMRRAFQRDDRGNLIKGLGSLDSAKEYVEWYKNTNQRLNDLVKSSNAKRGEKWVKNYLSKR